MVEKRGSKPKNFPKKKIVFFVVLAIIAVIGFSLLYSSSISTVPPSEGNDDVSKLVSGSRADAVEKF
ncbi:MAG: hypothetical protein WCF46_00905, partial [Nitrososphaeraceae archaeon]